MKTFWVPSLNLKGLTEGMAPKCESQATTVAPGNPQIVAQIEDRIAAMIQGFPEPVQKAYAEAQARNSDPSTPTGAYPQPLGK